MATAERNAELTEKLVDYALQHDVKAMFSEYLRRCCFSGLPPRVAA
jgi:hypothetical protein